MVDAIVVAADHLRRETEYGSKKISFPIRIINFLHLLEENVVFQPNVFCYSQMQQRPFSDDSLKTIIDSLRRQDIIVDAIGPTWGQENDDEDEQNDRPDSPMQTILMT